MNELIRDCEHCKHYIDNGEEKGCEKWECEFEREVKNL